MFGWLSLRRPRWRDELAQQLSHINNRLDQLETAPQADLSVGNIGQAVDHLLEKTEDRIDAAESLIRGLVDDVESVQGKQKDLTFAVSEGIERTDRAERRIHATIKRARKELSTLGYEDPGLEAEATQLRIVDGDGGLKGGVQPLPEAVESPTEEPSSIRGVPADTLRRVRGIQ